MRESIKQSLGELTRALLPVNANIGFHLGSGRHRNKTGEKLGVWLGMVDMTRAQPLSLDFKWMSKPQFCSFSRFLNGLCQTNEMYHKWKPGGSL